MPLSVSCHSDFLCLMSFSVHFTHCLCSRHRLLSVGTGINSVLKCTAEVPIRLLRETGMFVTRRTIGVGCEPARLGVILWLLHPAGPPSPPPPPAAPGTQTAARPGRPPATAGPRPRRCGRGRSSPRRPRPGCAPRWAPDQGWLDGCMVGFAASRSSSSPVHQLSRRRNTSRKYKPFCVRAALGTFGPTVGPACSSRHQSIIRSTAGNQAVLWSMLQDLKHFHA